VQLLEEDLRRSSERSGPEETLDVVALVLKELRALGEITDNYLQYARLPELSAAPLDINPAVGELVRFLRPEVARKGLALSARLGDGLPAVNADRRLLRLALMNLLKNAVEAMPAGGRLRVKTCQKNGAVEVHVADTGPGIAPSEAERIFEPFYTTKDSGSGLGLSLSRQIVEKHGGSLTCQSMVGVGTTFVVRLPVAATKK
jgi:signal transduction histidine kinase